MKTYSTGMGKTYSLIDLIYNSLNNEI